MGKRATPLWLKISFLVIVFNFGGRPGFGQILDLSPGELKARTRKSQKEAARFESEHKETHLAIDHFNFRKGKTGRKQVRVLEQPVDFVFDREINAIYPEARERARKSKKEISKAY